MLYLDCIIIDNVGVFCKMKRWIDNVNDHPFYETSDLSSSDDNHKKSVSQLPFMFFRGYRPIDVQYLITNNW